MTVRSYHSICVLHYPPLLVHRPVKDRFRPGGGSVDKPGRWTRGGVRSANSLSFKYPPLFPCSRTALHDVHEDVRPLTFFCCTVYEGKAVYAKLFQHQLRGRVRFPLFFVECLVAGQGRCRVNFLFIKQTLGF